MRDSELLLLAGAGALAFYFWKASSTATGNQLGRRQFGRRRLGCGQGCIQKGAGELKYFSARNLDNRWGFLNSGYNPYA